MARRARLRFGGLVVPFSFLLALVLTATPLPNWAILWQPEWVAIVLIYWCMAVPERVGVTSGWFVGLALDVVQGGLLGQNALALAVLAYVTATFHLRLRMFPLWQQAGAVLLLLVLHHGVLVWIRGVVGDYPAGWDVWMNTLSSVLIWPWLFIILRDARRRARLS